MQPDRRSSSPSRVAFVLGGGGVHGAAEVGMLQALAEHGIEPDLVVGTSVGALNGALLAADPSTALSRLTHLWTTIDEYSPFDASLIERASTFARTRTHLHGNHRLQRMLLSHLDVRRFDQLALPFQCVAASIERAGARWFHEGELVPALLATTAVPGLLPPVEIDGEHYLDGGLVDSIPVGRAVDLGARRIYVLQVGRIEQPLVPPTRPWEVGLVAFEIARRHRFVDAMERIPDGVEVHVLPSGADLEPTDTAQFRYRDTSNIAERIAGAAAASRAYLDSVRAGAGPGAPGVDGGAVAGDSGVDGGAVADAADVDSGPVAGAADVDGGAVAGAADVDGGAVGGAVDVEGAATPPGDSGPGHERER
jgi:NTE family protein